MSANETQCDAPLAGEGNARRAKDWLGSSFDTADTEAAESLHMTLRKADVEAFVLRHGVGMFRGSLRQGRLKCNKDITIRRSAILRDSNLLQDKRPRKRDSECESDIHPSAGPHDC